MLVGVQCDACSYHDIADVNAGISTKELRVEVLQGLGAAVEEFGKASLNLRLDSLQIDGLGTINRSEREGLGQPGRGTCERSSTLDGC